MYRNISYIVKRILIGTGIALLLMLIKGNLALKVSAREISMGVPTKLGFCSPTGCTIADQGQNATTYTAGNNTFYVSSYTQGTSGGVGFEWANAGLCVGQDLTFTGTAYLTDTAYSHTTITNVKGYFNSWSSNTNCSFVVGQRNNNMTRINYVCTGQGGGGLALYFHYNTDSAGSSLMVNSIQDIICDASNNDIVNSIESMNNNIINNQNENTQQIIQSITGGAEATIESQKVCTSEQTSINQFSKENYGLSSDGTERTTTNFNISKYYSLSDDSRIVTLLPYNSSSSGWYFCFYNSNKDVISCSSVASVSVNDVLTIPTGSRYFRTSILKGQNLPSFEIFNCKYGNQAIADGQQQINDTLNNDDITGASSEASSFFDNFTSDSHGLSGIITAPLRLIQSLSTSTCSSLTIPLPFVQTNATLPCMSTIYSTYFPTFLTLYQLITTGLIGYWVLIKLFGHVKGMQDPKDDRIEVLDL